MNKNNISPQWIELAVVADRDFIMPTVVMLTSAKMSKAPTSRYRVHFFLTSPLSNGEQKKIESLTDSDFEVLIHPTELSEQEKCLDTNRRNARFPGATMVRLRLPELLPEVDRVIYLDGDILVRRDLTSLYEEGMDNMLIGAVRDIGGELLFDSHKKLGLSLYVNSGVLIMNLTRLREEHTFAPVALQEVVDNKELIFIDQDIVNLMCAQSLKTLPPRYNAMLSLSKECHQFSLEAINKFYATSYESWMDMEEDAAIIHMAGAQKPWKYIDVAYSDLWMEAYKQSPYRHHTLCRTPNPDAIHALVAPMIPPAATQAKDSGRSERLWIRLFDFIPLLTIRRKANATRYLLFGFLPILKLKKRIY